MKIRTTLLVAASALAMVGGLAAPAGAARAHPFPVPPVNVANDTTHCSEVYGKVTFGLGLTFGGIGATTAASTLHMEDCMAGSFGITGVHTKGVGNFGATGVSRECANLIGLSAGQNVSGTIVWSREQASTVPAIPVSPTFAPGNSVVTIPQTFGSLLNQSWSDGNVSSYNYFQAGNDGNHGNTTQVTVNGAFTGGNFGHTSSFDLVTSQDYVAASVACTTVAGLKTLTFGVGQLTLS